MYDNCGSLAVKIGSLSACRRGVERRAGSVACNCQLPCSASLGLRDRSATLGINIATVNGLRADSCFT